MGRAIRTVAGGFAYHVLNLGGVGRISLGGVPLRRAECPACRAVRAAEQWQWSSLWRRELGDAESRTVLSKWPIDVPKDCVSRMNRAESRRELETLRRCVNRGQPFGSEDWVERMTKRFGLDSLFRLRGGPRKESTNSGS